MARSSSEFCSDLSSIACCCASSSSGSSESPPFTVSCSLRSVFLLRKARDSAVASRIWTRISTSSGASSLMRSRGSTAISRGAIIAFSALQTLFSCLSSSSAWGTVRGTPLSAPTTRTGLAPLGLAGEAAFGLARGLGLWGRQSAMSWAHSPMKAPTSPSWNLTSSLSDSWARRRADALLSVPCTFMLVCRAIVLSFLSNCWARVL
mmetsp:Transcript_140188/g.244167  ORF Transcript_140188/g.244167 Transcript_140188/m.244167 type:complete len:206 (+) Transcript_140188:601-1218(+)